MWLIITYRRANEELYNGKKRTVWHTGRGKIILNTVVRFRSFSCSVSFQCSKLSSCRRCYWRSKRVHFHLLEFWHFASVSIYDIHYSLGNEKKLKKTLQRLILSVCSPLLQFIGFIAGTENGRRKYKLSDFFSRFDFCF